MMNDIEKENRLILQQIYKAIIIPDIPAFLKVSRIRRILFDGP